MSDESQMGELYKKLALELISNAVRVIPEPTTRIILETFIGLITAEQSSNSELRRYVGSFYKVGMKCLRDARNAEQVEERKDAIKEARNRFRTASVADVDLLIRAKSQFYVGVCHHLLDERTNAKRWYEDAYTSGSQLATTLQQQLQMLLGWRGGLTKDQFLGSIAAGLGGIGLGVLLTPVLGPVGVVAGVQSGMAFSVSVNKYMRSHKARQARQQLEQLYDFMNPLSQILLAHGSTLSIPQKASFQGGIYHEITGMED